MCLVLWENSAFQMLDSVHELHICDQMIGPYDKVNRLPINLVINYFITDIYDKTIIKLKKKYDSKEPL